MDGSTHALSPWEIAQLRNGARSTSLIDSRVLAELAGVGRVLLKAEWERPLGNFKSLGGMIAGLRALARAAGLDSPRDLLAAGGAHATLPRLVCASDGNHGLAVTAAAIRVGARSCVYLPESADGFRASRIQALGGDVIRVAGTYDDAVCAAASAAAEDDSLLIADTSADPADPVVGDVMAGYRLMTDEIASRLGSRPDARPTHLFVQAGVGGLAAAMTDGLHTLMRPPGGFVVVEPASAACVAEALRLGRPARIAGDLHTCADMLSCGLASAPALQVLLRHGAQSVLVGEAQLRVAVSIVDRILGVATTPSGATGLAGFLQVASQAKLRAAHGLDAASCVLLVITEAAA